MRHATCDLWLKLQPKFTQRWAVAALVLLMTGGSASALTIRDDRNDSQYTGLANSEHPYGGLVQGNGWVGSATLISPNWILTAGHVLSGNITFQTSAGSRSVVEQVPYGSYDIGLARLDSPITTIDPVKLYDLSFGVEDGQAAVILGAGNTGTGLTGQQSGTGGTRRAAPRRRMFTPTRVPGAGAATNF